mmetsp:Transcript_79547/g.138014  ORF Transcript_79547/g.138014 Transcript_79547/m.138014 type:complete len:342 (+) Transcript_79547:98-1123(+)
MLAVGEGPTTCWSRSREKPAEVVIDKRTGLPGYHMRVHGQVDQQRAGVWFVEQGTESPQKRRLFGTCLCLDWAPDLRNGALSGWKVAVGCEDGNVSVIDSEMLVGEFPYEHPMRVSAVAWMPGRGTHLATGCADHVVRIFNTATGERVLRLQHLGPLRALSWHPEGTALVTGSNDKIARIWSMATGEQEGMLVHGDAVVCLAYSPDGSSIATGCADRRVKLIDPNSGKKLLDFPHKDVVRALAWRPDGKKIATACGDGFARIFDLLTGELDFQLRHGAEVTSVAWEAQSWRLATGCVDRCARVFEATGGAEVQRLRFNHRVACVSWQPCLEAAEAPAAEAG